MPDCFAYLGAMISFLLAQAFTPLARRLALWANLVAPVRPDRQHREVRPYGGGLAVLAAFAIVLAAMALLLPRVEDEIVYVDHNELARLGVGAILFFVLGLLDDRYAFSGGVKLLLQSACAATVVFVLNIKATVWLSVPGAPEAASLLWILAVVNAYNLFDHADGLAAACGILVLAAFAFGQMFVCREFDVVTGTSVVIPALILAGALAGFLRFNWPPAQLFMGDAGSMLVGYLLAALTMQARYYYRWYGQSRWVVLVPLALLAVPLFDMLCVTLGRIRRGESPFKGDATSHLGHRMLARGVRPGRVVLFVAAMTAITGAASIVMYHVEGWALAACWGAVAAVCGMMLLARRVRRPAAR